MQIELKDREGQKRIMACVTTQVDQQGLPYDLLTSLTDITDEKRAIAQRDALIDRSQFIMLAQNENGEIAHCSDAWVLRLGYSREETLGRGLVEFVAPDQRDEVAEIFAAFDPAHSRPRCEAQNIEVQINSKAGEELFFILDLRAERAGADWALIIMVTDVTALQKTQAELTRLVEHDELTGLLSRRGFKSRFSDACRSRNAGIFIVDVDHFKSINDAYGHDAGDALLIAIGQLLNEFANEGEGAVRFGGEEFALIRRWSGWEEAADFAEQLRQQLAQTEVSVSGNRISRTASIGYSCVAPNEEISQAMHLADLAQKEAKETGRNRCVAADERFWQVLNNRGAFIRHDEVLAALDANELSFVTQPICSAKSGEILGFEALIRWQLPSGEVLSPGQFLPVFQEVIREPDALALLFDLYGDLLSALADFPDQYVSFNFTLEQLIFKGTADAIHTQFSRRLDHPERRIVIEISEHTLNTRGNQDVMIGELQRLHRLGYLIALDDFGIESSNIQRLQDFPIDIVKIDQSLIRNITNSQNQRTTMKSLASMLELLGLAVIVEGIETQEQAEILCELGLEVHQGFLYAKPMHPDNLIALRGLSRSASAWQEFRQGAVA